MGDGGPRLYIPTHPREFTGFDSALPWCVATAIRLSSDFCHDRPVTPARPSVSAGTRHAR
jgi:hypothetical protein